MRPLVEKALEVVRSGGYRPPKLVLSAPTGYGKTVSAPLIASELIRGGFCYSFIHSLPFRAIVRDVYSCLILNSLTGSARLREVCRKSEDVLKVVRGALEECGVGIDDVAYQMGEHLSIDEHVPYGRKEPLFDARYVVTTLDSLVLNMFRIPVTEVYNYRKHYTIPWSRIYVSALFLDEAHAIVEDYDNESRSRAYTVFTKVLEIAGVARIPVVISSATLPKGLVNDIGKYLGEDVAIVELGKSTEESKRRVVVRDRDFESAVLGVKWVTKVIEGPEVVEKVLERVSSGRRVFVACDSIRRAVEIYREITARLGKERTLLLHSMLKMGDREERLDRLFTSRSIKVLVATNVVEAGVDVSFDDLVTDGGNPFSVVQRIGRICRDLSCEEAEIYVVKDSSDPQLLEFIERNGGRILWRLPYDVDGMSSYRELLDSIKLGEDLRVKRLLETLLHPLLVPQEEIRDVIKKMGGSLLRELLVTVVVGDVDKLCGASYWEVLKSTIVTNLERLRKLVSRGCIVGLYALVGDSEDPYRVVEVRPVDRELKWLFTGSKLEKAVVGEYLERLRNAYRERRNITSVAFLAKEECYGDEGLWRE